MSFNVKPGATTISPTKRSGWRRAGWVAATLFVLGIIAFAAAGPIMSRVEQPEYKVEVSKGPYEVRLYGPMIAAEATVTGERKAAIRDGFRLIAAYIFGANTPNAKIAMTAPVQQQKQTIAMTAPVTQQGSGQTWSVRFIMPKSWTMETLPAPNDARVVLKPVPQRRVVAVSFSGTASDAAIEQRTTELRRFAAERNLQTAGEPLFAFYNPPWTLPFLRRNEIILDVAG